MRFPTFGAFSGLCMVILPFCGLLPIDSAIGSRRASVRFVYGMQTFARVYTSKTLVTAGDLLYDRVLPFYEALGRKKLSSVVPKSVQSNRTTSSGEIGPGDEDVLWTVIARADKGFPAP